MRQIDKIHYGLSSLNFWRIVLCNFLFVLSACMIMHREAMGHPWVYLVFGLSCFVPGPVCGWLLDRYRRRFVVIWSIVIFVLSQLVVSGTLISPSAAEARVSTFVLTLMAIIHGGCFGVFQIAMGSTILIDSTASERRQPASYIYFASCFSGLVCALCFGHFLSSYAALWVVHLLPAFFSLAAVFLIARLRLPFRSPQYIPLFSSDRFWLGRAWPLALNYVLCFSAGCVVLSSYADMYGSLIVLGGSVLAYLGHGIFFRDADSRAEVVVGIILLLLSSILLAMGDELLYQRFALAFLGYGIGAFSNRYQNLFSLVSEHCERGRAHSTFSLCQILSICIGFFIGSRYVGSDGHVLPVSAASIFAFVLVFHQFVLQRWCQRNVRR